MKSPEAAMRSVLIQDTAVAAVIGTRIFPVLAPISAALPYITYRRTGVSREQTLSGPMGVATTTLDMDIFAVTYEEARTIADLCRQALDGWGGTLENTEVKNVSLESESDGFALLQGNEAPPSYSVTQTYNALWQES
jgi:hypothetical protein